MSERIKGQPGTPFEGLEFEMAEVEREGCGKCLAKRLGCGKECMKAITDPTISGNWIKPAPAPAQQAAQVCEWKLDDKHEYFSASCDLSFRILPRYSTELGFKFCPFCGKPIKEVAG